MVPVGHDQAAKMCLSIPRAAERYAGKVRAGIKGDPEAVPEARTILREYIPERIRMIQDEDGNVYADCRLHPSVLVKSGGSNGRDERI